MRQNILNDIYRSMAESNFAILSYGLRAGKMGWSLFLALYSERNGNSRARRLASELMTEALTHVRNMPAGLTEGTGGIIWALEYLKARSMIEIDDNLKKVYNYVMTDHMVRSSTGATHDLEDGFLTSALYSLFSYKPAETATHYMNVENLIYLTDECERIMTESVKGLYDPAQLPMSMLTSMLFFLKKVDAWRVYPFLTKRLLRLIPELHKEITVPHSLADDYVYHVLMNDETCTLNINHDIAKAANELGTLGFYSLIYDCPDIFCSAYSQWLLTDKSNERRLRKHIKDGLSEAGALCGLGFGLLNINTENHEDRP